MKSNIIFGCSISIKCTSARKSENIYLAILRILHIKRGKTTTYFSWTILHIHPYIHTRGWFYGDLMTTTSWRNAIYFLRELNVECSWVYIVFSPKIVGWVWDFEFSWEKTNLVYKSTCTYSKSPSISSHLVHTKLHCHYWVNKWIILHFCHQSKKKKKQEGKQKIKWHKLICISRLYNDLR